MSVGGDTSVITFVLKSSTVVVVEVVPVVVEAVVLVYVPVVVLTDVLVSVPVVVEAVVDENVEVEVDTVVVVVDATDILFCMANALKSGCPDAHVWTFSL